MFCEAHCSVKKSDLARTSWKGRVARLSSTAAMHCFSQRPTLLCVRCRAAQWPRQCWVALCLRSCSWYRC